MLTVASPGIFAVVAVCVLGMAFMVRFLIAVASDETKIRVMHPLGPRDARGDAVVNPAGHLAVGVVRITTALASNARENTLVERARPVTFAARSRGCEPAIERRYSWK
jgi:hypothetical protein